VLKPGGIALMIGPLRPENWLGRFLADTWMLFPEEKEYFQWFEAAGFVDLQKRYIKPNWVSREKYGIALAGRKPQAGESMAPLSVAKTEKREDPLTLSRFLLLIPRLIIGSLAGFFFIPIALFGHIRRFFRRLLGRASADETPEKLTPEQKLSLIMLGFILIFLLWWITGG
jgi:MPBQ/MSBQ methyltransferase